MRLWVAPRALRNCPPSAPWAGASGRPLNFTVRRNGGHTMDHHLMSDFLLCCTILNYLVLLVWFSAFSLAHEWMFRLHGRWFRLAPAQFDALHYGAMAAYKVGILLLNLVPLIALNIVARHAS